VIVWVLRLLWVSLPFTAGPVFVDALDTTRDSFRISVAIGLWSLWAICLVALLVPHTWTLVIARVTAPGAVAAAIWATAAAGSTATGAGALAVAGVTAVVSLSAPVGTHHVNGTSYGDERRLLLRPPGPLLLGPIELAWGVAVAGALAGPLLLADEQWIVGGIVAAIGIPAAFLALRALHGLARRWIVFVPAGLVVHDVSSLVDPHLFRRVDIARVGPALADSTALDLTQAAPGLALEIDLTGPMKIARRHGRQRAVDPVETAAILITPSLPGIVLAEADGRRITVG